MTSFAARPRRGFALGTDYTRWLLAWLPCDEAPGSLTLLDHSGNGNDVSPNYAPVWTPGFTVGNITGTANASFLKCMRPATPFNSDYLLEPTAIGGSGIGITAAVEPNWTLSAGAQTVDNTGTNSITWTARQAAIAFNGIDPLATTYGVVTGLGGSVCVPKSSRGMFEGVMGWNKTDTWEYTATTLSATSGGIHDSAAGIPTGLVAGNFVLATGFATADDQMFCGVTSATTSDIVVPGGMLSADTNAGALPITLRRVHVPQVVVISAWYTPLTASATTNPGYLLRAATNFGSSGSFGAIVARAREDGTRRVMIEIVSPSNSLLSVTRSGNGTVGTPAHICWVFDRVSLLNSIYVDGVFNASIALTPRSRCVLRDVSDATWNARRFLMQFFAGNAIAAYRDVQLYAGPALPTFGLGSTFNSLVLKMKNGLGPLTQSDWP